MKISQTTMDVLKNFAVVQESLLVREPQCIVTMSTAKNIVALFDTEETFPEFGIWDLQQFLGAISLFDLADTEFDFQKKWVNIRCGTNSIRYTYTNVNHVTNSEHIKPSRRYKAFDEFNCHFKLCEGDITKLKKASTIMFGNNDATNINIHSDGEKGYVKLDVGDDIMSNTFKTEVEEIEGKCDINIHVGNLVLLRGGYEVDVLDKKLVRFKHETLPLMYFVSPKIM